MLVVKALQKLMVLRFYSQRWIYVWELICNSTNFLFFLASITTRMDSLIICHSQRIYFKLSTPTIRLYSHCVGSRKLHCIKSCGLVIRPRVHCVCLCQRIRWLCELVLVMADMATIFTHFIYHLFNPYAGACLYCSHIEKTSVFLWC